MNSDLLITIGLVFFVVMPIYVRLTRLQQKPPYPKKKFARSLWGGEPIVPRHRRPASTDAWSDQDKLFFSDFADFGDVVNWWLADEYVGSPWRLQELPETDLMTGAPFVDGPSYGRSYEIFYNQARMGKMEIEATLDFDPSHGHRWYGERGNGSEASRQMRTTIVLRWVRLLDYDEVVGFLTDIAEHVTDHPNGPSGKERQAALSAINLSMLKCLWSDYEISQFPDLDGQNWGDLSVAFTGTPSFYLRRRDSKGFAELKAAMPPEVTPKKETATQRLDAVVRTFKKFLVACHLQFLA